MARGLIIWCLIMLVETIHGILRALFLAPHLGAAAAERIGWPIAAVLVIGIALLSIRWTGLVSAARLLALGGTWAALTVLFELTIGLLRGLAPADLAAALNPASGSVAWSAALMLITPLLAARLRGLR